MLAFHWLGGQRSTSSHHPDAVRMSLVWVAPPRPPGSPLPTRSAAVRAALKAIAAGIGAERDKRQWVRSPPPSPSLPAPP